MNDIRDDADKRQQAIELLRELTGEVSDCLDGSIPHDSLTYRGTLLHRMTEAVCVLLQDDPYLRCPSCDKGITKSQIDEAYREYWND